MPELSHPQALARVAHLEAQMMQLRSQLVTDDLMQILNRRGLLEYLDALTKEVRWQSEHPDKRRNVVVRSLSVLFVDIDHFKAINTEHGHEAGDIVLKSIAATIKDQVRALDIVGRYGGEEIVVGLVGATAGDAERVAENIRVGIEQLKVVLPNHATVHVTASLGVAEVTANISLVEAIKLADEALYAAKANGRNQVVTASQA